MNPREHTVVVAAAFAFNFLLEAGRVTIRPALQQSIATDTVAVYPPGAGTRVRMIDGPDKLSEILLPRSINIIK